jgi:hypothetical protein
VPAEWSLVLHGWPGYRSADLVRLGVLAASGGRSDETGWPAADKLVPYYRDHYRPGVVAVPLAEDPGLVMANVFGAVTTTADITVSLCRMGRADLPGRQVVEVRLLDEDDPGYNPNLDFILHDLARAIASWRETGKTVLVHCVQAERRTPAVAAAYLAEVCGLAGPAALRRVFAQLPRPYLNRAFSAALGRGWPAPRAAAGWSGLGDGAPL